jgi:hypothetical protein
MHILIATIRPRKVALLAPHQDLDVTLADLDDIVRQVQRALAAGGAAETNDKDERNST